MGEQRTALVTGASSGIGVAIACAFGALGWRVAIGARREDRLADTARAVEAAGGRVFAGFVDVARADTIDTFFSNAEQALGPIDTVVSNAGVGRPGLLHEIAIEKLQEEIAIDLVGTMLVARRALPSMIERATGDLVFISSMAVVEPRPFQAGYAAAKAGVEAMAAVLRKDLEGTGVRTTVVRLGPTRSEFGLGWDSDVLLRVIESWEKWGYMRHLDVLEPEEVAGAIVAAVTAPPNAGSDVLQLNPCGRKGSA
jgi:NADP-dependent 3-hydroxy acid dehydrogenase YdfG